MPPLRRSSERDTEILHGAHLGSPARVCAARYSDPVSMMQSVTVTVSVDAPTYGVIIYVGSRPSRTIHLGAPPPVRTETLEWNADFRAKFRVSGAPFAVLRSWLTPVLQATLLQSGVSFITSDSERIEVGIPSDAAAHPAALKAVLDATHLLMSGLPDALSAGGAHAYLQAGSLAGHPDVIAYRRDTRRRVFKGTCLVLALLALAGALIAAVAKAVSFVV